jgi:O-antigen/teichoic acid export membrane protein
VKAPGAAVRRLALLGVARGVAAGLGLAGVLIVARLLSPAQLGQWSLALAVQGYALHLGEFGLRGVVTTEAARAGRQLPRLLRRYLALRLAISAMVLTLVTAECALLRPGEVPLVGLVTLTIVPVALQLDWLALVDDRPRLAAGLLVVRPLAFLALLGLAPASNGLIGIAGCFLVAWILAALLSWTACRRPAPSAAGSVPSPARMLRRGAALAAVAVTNQAQLSADLLVVGWALGASPAGDYYLASQVLVAGLLFANAAGQIALARLPAVAAQPPMLLAALTRELTALVRVAGAGAAAIALSGSTLMPLLFGAEHAGAAVPLLWLLPWFVLQHPSTLFQAALAAVGREDDVVRANLLALGVLLVGLAAAADGTSLAAFAVVRGVAEATRLVALGGFLRRQRLLPRLRTPTLLRAWGVAKR